MGAKCVLLYVLFLFEFFYHQRLFISFLDYYLVYLVIYINITNTSRNFSGRGLEDIRILVGLTLSMFQVMG
ncbi:hypothetical protein DSUL_50459 [Desulfovibrionales bacterium]